MNGYKNYSTWNIVTGLSNKDSANDYIIMLADEAKKKSENPRNTLGEQIKTYVEDNMPDLEPGIYKDLLKWAIEEADFYQIADTYLS
jgi:hypothetical protein